MPEIEPTDEAVRQAKRKVLLAFVGAACLAVAGVLSLVTGDTPRGVVLLVVGIALGGYAVREQKNLTQ